MSTPSQIGPYPILAKLGEGGMGGVYLGLHKGLGGFERNVAVKCILPHVAADKQFIEMLFDEARLTAQLTHPNIVQVIDLAESEGTYFLVMEYVEGADLFTLVRDHRLGLDEAAYIIAEAARGLAYAHRKTSPEGRPLRIVHRDISAHNILISVEGGVKIVDFGVAKASSKRQQTQVGVLKGKIPYMSPEQATGKPLDGRSDLFSLGVVLWEIATGSRLFEGDTEIQTLMKVQRCEVEPPSRIVPGFPRKLEEVILRCLQVSPDNRYADGDKLADALETFIQEYAGEQPPRRQVADRMQSLVAEKRPAASDVSSTLGEAAHTITAPISKKTKVVATSEGKPKVRKRTIAACVGGFLLLLLAALIIYRGNNGADTAAIPTSPSVTAAQAPTIGSEKPERTKSKPVKTKPAREPTRTRTQKTRANADSAKETPTVVTTHKASQKSTKASPKTSAPRKSKARQISSTSPKKAATPPPREASKAPPREKAEVGESGFLSLNAVPWARVYIGGSKVADSTPLFKHELPAGTHRVVLVNPELRVRKQIDVQITAGVHERRRISMEEKP